jgi:tetratricopeptide (TPR) repeat protein
LQGDGRLSEAIACFDQALDLRPLDPETWYNRGVALEALGDVVAALHSYDAALAQRPNYLWALTRRCDALAKLGRLEEALELANALVSAKADCPDSWCRRGNILQELGRYGDALASYNQALALRSAFPAALINRATTLNEIGRYDEALLDLDAALEFDPDQPQGLIARANVFQSLGRKAEAEAAYRRVFAMRPLITHHAVTQEPEFQALFVFAPISGNTPIHDMISFSNYESSILILLPDAEYEVDFLRSRADVVVNLVSDVDCSGPALAQVSDLIARLAKPVVNEPAKVLITDRENVARLLATTENCRVPITRRFTSEALLALTQSQSLDVSFPLIVRVAGTHGSDEMEQLSDVRNLEAFVRDRPESEFHVFEFIDYRSADGLFRKYRFIFVGDEILPYHLAISSQWKVHHASTDMANQAWMQAEEKKFLQHPETVFSPEAFGALRAIQSKSVSTISASAAPWTAKAGSSCSRSMPRCSCICAMTPSHTRMSRCGGSRRLLRRC